MPRDYVEEDRAAVEVRRSGNVLTLRAAKPLARAVPVAVWDGEIAGDRPGRVFQPPQLDDGRTHTVLELPAGWHGECVLAVRNVSEPPGRRICRIGSSGMAGAADRGTLLFVPRFPGHAPL